jgi:monothiol glutaredoxin
MPLDRAIKDRIDSVIQSNDVVLFMKGDRTQPQCGFSAKVVQMLDAIVSDYETVDVLADQQIREAIKEYSNWPTIPQLYVRGEFIGGCDIVTDLFSSGELHAKFGVEPPERVQPKITITPAAAEKLKEFIQRSPGKGLQLSIDAGFNAQLGLAPLNDNAIAAESNGVTVYMDLMTAPRADGVTIDIVDGLNGPSFKLDNPNAPPPVNQVLPQELKKLIDEGIEFEFFDVRTPEERAIAQIAGTHLLDEETAKSIERLPKDTMLVFHCHHGGRSQQAAEHFRSRGFTKVYNLAGGIDAWAAEVDPSLARY